MCHSPDTEPSDYSLTTDRGPGEEGDQRVGGGGGVEGGVLVLELKIYNCFSSVSSCQ